MLSGLFSRCVHTDTIVFLAIRNLYDLDIKSKIRRKMAYMTAVLLERRAGSSGNDVNDYLPLLLIRARLNGKT